MRDWRLRGGDRPRIDLPVLHFALGGDCQLGLARSAAETHRQAQAGKHHGRRGNQSNSLVHRFCSRVKFF